MKNNVAIVSGGDSGIGRAVSLHFAKEGAKVAIIYLDEHKDANEIKDLIEEKNVECLLISGDISEPLFCKLAVGKTIKHFNQLDILVNNAAKLAPAYVYLASDESSYVSGQTIHVNGGIIVGS